MTIKHFTAIFWIKVQDINIWITLYCFLIIYIIFKNIKNTLFKKSDTLYLKQQHTGLLNIVYLLFFPLHAILDYIST